MKKITFLVFAAFAVLCGLALESNAQTNRSRSINNRQSRQQQRIVNGVKTGELTARETYRLEREQLQIRRMENRFRRTGDGLSPSERYRLERELNQSSRHIYRQKNDAQDYPRRRL